MPGSTDEALHRRLDDGRARAGSTDPEQAALWEALAAATEGGKRFRPALVAAAHAALRGTRPAAAAEVGAAIELLHTAFDIHDDVIDGDEMRRGRLNVSGTFHAQALTDGADPEDAAAYGRTAGILAGDLALAAAVRAVATCGAPRDVVDRLLDLFDAALHTTAAGELADVRLSLGLETCSLEECLAMEEQKTSAYSFSLPLQAGALLAGADEATVTGLGEAGRSLGIAFQLLDDVIGVFGDPAVTGKSTTADLRARKQTPLLAHARRTPQWEQIVGFLGRDLDDDDLQQVRGLLTASGSRRFVEELAESHLLRARRTVEEAGIPAELITSLMTAAPAAAPAADASEVAA